ncbi:hypothetical protein Y032_0259g505 [Ancylostoma ceylanicum]|uniref:Ig-like domain-containing protein n=1 Tax=Ancylostoma ceylanicum TaxID=53326 RepID=A0A016SBL1_9BILA|nr:hypothetical protein Y032_0259g505 [Ancylostoma ceylanicum]
MEPGLENMQGVAGPPIRARQFSGESAILCLLLILSFLNKGKGINLIELVVGEKLHLDCPPADYSHLTGYIEYVLRNGTMSPNFRKHNANTVWKDIPKISYMQTGVYDCFVRPDKDDPSDLLYVNSWHVVVYDEQDIVHAKLNVELIRTRPRHIAIQWDVKWDDGVKSAHFQYHIYVFSFTVESTEPFRINATEQAGKANYNVSNVEASYIAVLEVRFREHVLKEVRRRVNVPRTSEPEIHLRMIEGFGNAIAFHWNVQGHESWEKPSCLITYMLEDEMALRSSNSIQSQVITSSMQFFNRWMQYPIS